MTGRDSRWQQSGTSHSLLVPSTGPTDPVLHYGGLTGSAYSVCLTSPPILVMPDWTKPFILVTDANEVGIGAALSQYDPDGGEHVITYASRLLTRPGRKYCVTCKESLAVVDFLNHF